MPERSKDRQAVFAVRAVLLVAVLALVVGLAVAGMAKIVDPTFDAGTLAVDVAWPAGVILGLVVLLLRRRNRAL